MGLPFDHIALSYDSSLKQTPIGQLQRRQVWNYLEKIMPELPGLDILELTCGTGEDAILFSENGLSIVATDISEETLKLTQEKVQQYSMQHKISSKYLNLDSFDDSLFEKKFDLVFSNFGGLNSISPDSFQKLLDKLPGILTPQGRFVAVMMPKFCLWETVFFSLRFQFRKAFSRWNNRSVERTGSAARTCYFTPSLIKAKAKHFSIVKTKPIGIALPPSYLDHFSSKHTRLIIMLNKLEKKLNRFSFLSGISDHYLIDLKVKKGKGFLR